MPYYGTPVAGVVEIHGVLKFVPGCARGAWPSLIAFIFSGMALAPQDPHGTRDRAALRIMRNGHLAATLT